MILKDEHYIYSLLGGSTKEGKQKGAFYLLTDAIIGIMPGQIKYFVLKVRIFRVFLFDNLFGPEEYHTSTWL
jgi:hypothetical protein